MSRFNLVIWSSIAVFTAWSYNCGCETKDAAQNNQSNKLATQPTIGHRPMACKKYVLGLFRFRTSVWVPASEFDFDLDSRLRPPISNLILVSDREARWPKIRACRANHFFGSRRVKRPTACADKLWKTLCMSWPAYAPGVVAGRGQALHFLVGVRTWCGCQSDFELDLICFWGPIPLKMQITNKIL